MGTNVRPQVGPTTKVNPETDSYLLATESSELHILMAALLQGINDTVNNLLANRTNEGDLEYFYFYRTEQLTFLWIIFTVIVVGNVSVLGALLLSKSKKSRMNFFIMQLAIADLSVGLTNVLTDIIWKMTIDFHGGNILCKIIKFLQVLVTYGSTYVLVALSIDRYDAITHPMNFSGSWKRARILVASAWGMSALLSIPALFLNEEKFINGRCQCWIELEDHEWQIYITLVAVSLFFIPALIISACYGVIVYTIWTKSKIMAYPKLTKTSTVVKGQNETLKKKNKADDVEHKRASSRGIIPKAKIKTVKMTFVIVFVFVLCWSPYFVYDLLQVYGYIKISQTSLAISTFIQSLAPLNSAANPVIYCLFSTQLCRNLRRLPLCNWLAEHLCCCWPSVRRMARSGSLQRPTEYSTMTETAISRSSGRSSANSQRIQLHSCRNVPKKTLLLSQKRLECGGRSTSINASFAPNHLPSSTVILSGDEKSTIENSFV